MADGDVDTSALPVTGPLSEPLSEPLSAPATAAWSIDDDDEDEAEAEDDEPALAEPVAEPAAAAPVAVSASTAAPTSVSVPGQYHFLTWWKLALLLLAVWIPAAGIGLGLFAWWYALTDKTPAVFVVLVYVVVTTVAGVILAMVVDKPLLSAVAIGLTSALFISGVAAAPLYGHYFCQHAQRCLGGILPY